MKSFFFQVLYCGYKSFERWIFTKGRNPHGRNENSNTIYSSDPAHGLDAGTGAHSRAEREEAGGRQVRIILRYWSHVPRFQEPVPYMHSHGTCLTSGNSMNGFHNSFNNTVWHPDININKRDILVHPIIFYILACPHQHLPGLLVTFNCFHWHRLHLPHEFLILM